MVFTYSEAGRGEQPPQGYWSPVEIRRGSLYKRQFSSSPWFGSRTKPVAIWDTGSNQTIVCYSLMKELATPALYQVKVAGLGSVAERYAYYVDLKFGEVEFFES